MQRRKTQQHAQRVKQYTCTPKAVVFACMQMDFSSQPSTSHPVHMMLCYASLFTLAGAVIAQSTTADEWGNAIPCSTVDNKVPNVYVPVGDSVEKTLDRDEKVEFEYYLGQAMLKTSAVESASKMFALRLYKFIVSAGLDILSLETEDQALLTAFAKGDVHLSGFVGPDAGHIREVFTDWSMNRTGNLRNVWSTVYAFFNSPDFKLAFEKAPVNYLSDTLGFGPFALVAMEERRWLVEQTKMLPDNLTYAQGVPDYYFPPFDSWVRFSFAVNGRWGGARKNKPNVTEVSWMSNDPQIQPPLSPDELWYQCGGPGPCKLKWITGEQRFYVGEEPLGSQPGLRARADMAGYLTVAGASGTTANIMQLAKLLGFRGEDLVVLRAAAMAFMLPMRHHSFFEVMLGAEPFMPAGFGMALGKKDLGQLWPRDVHTSWGETFSKTDLWATVNASFQEEPAQMLISRMDAESAAYVRSLLSQETADSPLVATLV